jgi:hypothetical protein
MNNDLMMMLMMAVALGDKKDPTALLETVLGTSDLLSPFARLLVTRNAVKSAQQSAAAVEAQLLQDVRAFFHDNPNVAVGERYAALAAFLASNNHPSIVRAPTAPSATISPTPPA